MNRVIAMMISIAILALAGCDKNTATTPRDDGSGDGNTEEFVVGPGGGEHLVEQRLHRVMHLPPGISLADLGVDDLGHLGLRTGRDLVGLEVNPELGPGPVGQGTPAVH